MRTPRGEERVGGGELRERQAGTDGSGARTAAGREPVSAGATVVTRHVHERGSVTAELAVGLPAVVIVLVAVLVLAASALTQLRCADAARAGARAAAIGEDTSEVRATATRVAGSGAQVAVGREGEWVTVSVSAAVTGTSLRAGPLVARASAVARVEP